MASLSVPPARRRHWRRPSGNATTVLRWLGDLFLVAAIVDPLVLTSSAPAILRGIGFVLCVLVVVASTLDLLLSWVARALR